MSEDAEEELDFCCVDNWSVWRRFETWIWAILLIVQLSMVVFLVLYGRKDKTFRQAFYVFFVVVTVDDCVLVLLRNMREWDETVFGTQYDYHPAFRQWISDLTQSLIVPVFSHAQPLFLTAIAVNRFTAFCLPLKHSAIWRTRTVVRVVAAVAVTSTILGVLCPVAIIVRQAVLCSAVTWKRWDELNCAEIWAFNLDALPLALVTLTSAICAVLSLALNVASVTTFIVLRAKGKLQQKGPELRLFVHSIYVFLLQFLLAFQDFVYVTDRLYFINDDLGVEGFPWASVPHSTEWLAGVEGVRKMDHEFDELYFTPGCKTSTGDWRGVKPPLPICRLWYRFLVGDLRLRDGARNYTGIFTVRTLEQCLLALSGSVTLLLISGNVRQAYFKFYLRKNCMWRNRRSRVSSIGAH